MSLEELIIHFEERSFKALNKISSKPWNSVHILDSRRCVPILLLYSYLLPLKYCLYFIALPPVNYHLIFFQIFSYIIVVTCRQVSQVIYLNHNKYTIFWGSRQLMFTIKKCLWMISNILIEVWNLILIISALLSCHNVEKL